jgi:L-glutamine:2-deoxy-scyllo-inosose/3-amino-2,3-dideoxy-scyllo-inosose aminotransferase
VRAIPVFADVDGTTAMLDLDLVREVVTPRTVAILRVHLHGRCADVGGLAELAAGLALWLVEDAAQATGARWNGRAGGSVSLAAPNSQTPAEAR